MAPGYLIILITRYPVINNNKIPLVAPRYLIIILINNKIPYPGTHNDT